jgi:hypothetical protein
MASVGSSRNGGTTIGISLPSQRDMLTDVNRYATVVEKSAGFREPVFYIDKCVALRTVALDGRFLIRKKGSATISVGLNYFSMGLSQPNIS